jgi:hypothetical protein
MIQNNNGNQNIFLLKNIKEVKIQKKKINLIDILFLK